MDPNSTGTSPRFDMNRAFGEAQGIFGESAGLFAGLALVFGIPGAIAELVTRDAGTLMAILVPLVVASLFTAVSEAAITLGALRRVKGAPLGGDLLAAAVDLYIPVMVALLLGSFAAALGFTLFILPGVLVMAFIFFAIPAIIEEITEESAGESVVEAAVENMDESAGENVGEGAGETLGGVRRGIKGLEQSARLGDGYRMEIFLMVFLFILVLVGVQLTLDYLLGSAPLLAAFATWAAGGVISAFGTVLAVTSYAQLRALHRRPLKQDPTPRPQ